MKHFISLQSNLCEQENLSKKRYQSKNNKRPCRIHVHMEKESLWEFFSFDFCFEYSMESTTLFNQNVRTGCIWCRTWIWKEEIYFLYSDKSPCPRFLIKTAVYRRSIEKPSVRIGFAFCTLLFTDFSAISVWNLMKMFVFIKRIGL